MARSELRDLEQRPQRYWNIDGIPELVMGAFWLIWGGGILLGEALPSERALGVYGLLLAPVLALSGFGLRRAIGKVKERLTYPRTGYVGYPKSGPWTRVLAVVLAIGSVVLVAWLIATGRGVATSAVGLVVCLIFLAAFVRQRAPHLLALASLALALGVALPSLSWLFVCLGATATALGGWRLRRYLRANPR